MSYPVSETNILYAGAQYHNSETPIWASALTGISTVGPNLQVSSITLPSNGALIMDNTTPNSAVIVFDRPVEDILNTPSLIKMNTNVVPGGNATNISITNATQTFYDDLALGNLLVYGENSIANPNGLVGSIGQYQNQTALAINSPSVYTSSIWISSINGQVYGVGTVGANIEVSTLQVNPLGFMRLNADGTSTNVLTAGLFFQYTPDIGATFNPALKLTTNNTNGALGVSSIENISLTLVDAIEGIKYNTLALGDLLVYGTNNPKASTVGQVALMRQYSTTTDLEVVTTGLHTENLIASTVNGYQFPGGAVVPTNIQISTMQVNANGSILLSAVGASTAAIRFDKAAVLQPTVDFSIETLVSRSQAGLSTVSEVLALTRTAGIPTAITRFEQLALGELLVYGRSNPITSTIGQVGRLTEWSSDSTDLLCITSAFRTESTITSTLAVNTAYISTLYVSSIVDFVVSVSTINASTVVSSNVTASVFNASSIKFDGSLGGIDLGIGSFAGAFAGQFASEVLTMSMAGSALATGVIGLIVPRTTNNINIPGEPSTFQTVNLQTQLQYSTLGVATSTFYRFVSSSDGLNGTVTPGQEYIISSIIAPGTTCIRSFSDPINLANDSTFTSTVQSFGYWIPVPNQSQFSTVGGDFVVRSTLTAYRLNVSTSAAVQGGFQAGNITSVGVVAAGTNITAGGNVNAFGTGTFTSGLATGGLISGASLNIIGGGGYIEPFVSTTQVDAFDVNAQIADIGIGNITIVNTQTLNAGNCFITNANTSNINVSSINGLPYSPGGGGGGTLGLFSTVIVSSLTTTSSLTVTGDTNIPNLTAGSTFTNSISTNQLTALGIGAFSAQIGAGTPTLYNNQGIYNPVGQIDYGIGNISSISNNVFWNKTTSTQALFVSSLNGAIYPPPFPNSTIIGDFIVTSTLTAYNVVVTNDISASSDIFSQTSLTTNGFITGTTITGSNITSLTFINGQSANIGGVIIGTASNITARQINASNITASTINGEPFPSLSFPSTVTGNFIVQSTITAYAINVSTNLIAKGVITAQNSILASNNITAGGTVQGGFIQAIAQISGDTLNVGTTAAIPAITGLNTVNGIAYPPPPIPVSSYQRLFTSSLITSTVTTAGNVSIGGVVNATGSVTAGSFSSAGNYNGLSATYPGVNISIAGSGNITAGNIATNGGAFISTNTSSITVSSINGITYPPPSSPFNPNPQYSTVTVSSLLTTTGLVAQSANIGGTTIVGNQVTANLLVGTQVNAGIVNVSTITRAGGAGFPITITNVIQGTAIRTFNNPWTVFTSSVGAEACFAAPELYGDYIGSFNSGFNSAISFGRPISGAAGDSTLTVKYGISGATGTSTLNIISGLTTNQVFVGSYVSSFIDITGPSISMYDTLGNQTAIEANKIIQVSGAGPRTEIFPGQIGVFQTASLTSTIGIQIIGPQLNILTSNDAQAGIVNGGISQLGGNVIAKRINNQPNVSTFTSGYYYGTRWFDVNVPSAPQSFMPLTQSLMATGFYNFGATYAFYSGIPAIVPFSVVSFSPFTPCVMRVLFNTNRNLLGPPGLALLGAWDVVVLWANYSGGPQISITVNTIMSQNVGLSLTPTGPGSIVYLLTLTPNGGFGTPQPRNGRVSWTIQPLEPPIDVDPNPFVP
jgi:hypothetical protein